MNTRKFLLICGALALMLRALTTGLRAAEYHDCVVVVLDASGSMKIRMAGSGMDRMEAAKAALKEVLKQVPQDTHIGLLVFSAANVKNDWLYPLGPRDDRKLAEAIDLPYPGAGTPLGAYMKKGADRLLEERAKQYGYGSYRLLVVTDGEASDPEVMEKHTPEIMARGITLDVIGVAMKGNHTLATKVHSYRGANDPAALKRAVAEVFAEVGNTKTDSAQEDVFAQIASIPTPVAASMIQALSTSGNHPIGEKPPVPVVPPPPTTRPESATPVSIPSSPAPVPVVAPVHLSPLFWIIATLVGAILLRMFNKSRR